MTATIAPKERSACGQIHQVSGGVGSLRIRRVWTIELTMTTVIAMPQADPILVVRAAGDVREVDEVDEVMVPPPRPHR